jgi:5-formyltetrahydrofolate cyclo-ligase
VNHLQGLPEWERARSIALYAALPGEVPVDEVRADLDARGVGVAFPRLAEAEIVLHRVGCDDVLSAGGHGIREPSSSAPRVPPEKIELFVVPGLLFDRSGARLGRGGGHYDRLMARANPDAHRVGLCYADRVVDRLPMDPWDERMDVVVTDREIFRVPRVNGRETG